MSCIIPANLTPREHHYLISLLPAHVQLQAARRGDVIHRLDRCDVEDDKIETFDCALIEDGGTHIGPATTGRPGDHQHEIELLGIYGCGESYAAAISDWQKAALRMGSA